MPRSVSTAALQGALAQQTDEIYLVLVEINHPSLMTPLRFVNNSDGDDVTSNGDVYTAYPFEMKMPDDQEGKEPTAEIRIDNVDRELMDEVRSITGELTMEISVVLQSTPDTIEWGPLDFEVRGVTYDASNIIFRLSYSVFIREPFPYIAFDTTNFPGMFQ